MTEEQIEELFREYRKTGSTELRNKLVEHYFYIAEILAKKFSGRGVEYDDLLQIASESLISGVEKFDPLHNLHNPHNHGQYKKLLP